MINYSQVKKDQDLLQGVAHFLLQYACTQLAAGGQTLRVVRTVDRLAKCFGFNCHATFLSRHITMTVSSPGMHPVTLVGTVPNMGLNFRQLIALNNLSWLAHDRMLSFSEVMQRFLSILAIPRYKFWQILLVASIANASFCRLFGGDYMAMGLVFGSTILALGFRRYLENRHAAPCLSFTLSAFAGSFITAAGTLSGISATPQIAIGSSVLFLIPGVPMINSTLDLLTGFPLMAFSRLVRSGLLVICIGLGLSATLYLTGLEMGTLMPAGENTCLFGDIIQDAVFAALAAMGFAMLSNPDVFVICAGGALAALGHSARFYLLHATSLGIIPASLFSAALIGLFCVILSRRFHIPGEFFSFLALLPMIPGMYAYDVILSTIKFMNTAALDLSMQYLVTMVKDVLTVMFILCGLSIGAITPLLAQHFLINMPGSPYGSETRNK